MTNDHDLSPDRVRDQLRALRAELASTMARVDRMLGAEQPIAGDDPDPIIRGAAEIARRLFGSSDTAAAQRVYRLVSAGRIPGAQKIGRLIFVRASALDAFARAKVPSEVPADARAEH